MSSAKAMQINSEFFGNTVFKYSTQSFFCGAGVNSQYITFSETALPPPFHKALLVGGWEGKHFPVKELIC